MSQPTEALAVDRNGLEVLDLDTCMALAGSVPVARVAVNAPGSPVVMPITHVVIGLHVLFRSASGSKLDAAIMNEPITIEVDDWDLATKTGWSVIIRGSAEPVPDEEVTPELTSLIDEPWINTPRSMSWIRVRPDEVTGRRIPPTEA